MRSPQITQVALNPVTSVLTRGRQGQIRWRRKKLEGRGRDGAKWARAEEATGAEGLALPRSLQRELASASTWTWDFWPPEP